MPWNPYAQPKTGQQLLGAGSPSVLDSALPGANNPFSLEDVDAEVDKQRQLAAKQSISTGQEAPGLQLGGVDPGIVPLPEDQKRLATVKPAYDPKDFESSPVTRPGQSVETTASKRPLSTGTVGRGSTGLYQEAFTKQQEADEKRREAERKTLALQQDNQQKQAEKENQELSLAVDEDARIIEEKQKSDQRIRKDIDSFTAETEQLEKNPPKNILDPNKWWNSRSDGQKVLAMFGRVLTSFGGAPDIIGEAIKNDIDAQKFNIENEKDQYQRQMTRRNTTYGQMLDKFKDPEIAYQQSIAHNSRITANKLLQRANTAKTEEDKVKLTRAYDDLNQQSESAKALAVQRQGDLARQREVESARRAAIYREDLLRGREEEKYGISYINGVAYTTNPDGTPGVPLASKREPTDSSSTETKAKSADVNAGVTAIENTASQLGLKWNPTTQEYEGSDVGSTVLQTVVGDSAKAKAAVDTSAPVVGRGLEGNAPNQSTMDQLSSNNVLSAVPGRTKNNLTMQRRMMEARLKAQNGNK